MRRSARGFKTCSNYTNRRQEGREDVLNPRSSNKSVHELLSDLKSCSRTRDLLEGRRIHRAAVKTGSDYNVYVAAALINMYAKCSCMLDAQQVFDRIKEPDVVSWNALIVGYADNGQGQVAMDLFSKMKAAPDSATYVGVLKACTSLAASGLEKQECLKQGREIHSKIGRNMNPFVQSTLINMYAKCGNLVEARRVFDSLEETNVVSWNALIVGYADNGQGQDALDLFSRMKDGNRCAPNSVTYVGALKACTSLAANGNEQECLKHGRRIHSEIGHHMDQFLQSTLINMYSKCGCMVEAQRVFDDIQGPNVVSWTTLIVGYADNGQGQDALGLFSRMKAGKCIPNSLTFVGALKACTSLAADGDKARKGECLKRGREIHSEAGKHTNLILRNALINMYAKCGSMDEAHRVFEKTKEPDVVSWNALIVGYADNGQGQEALELFSKMKATRTCAPDSLTYIGALKACTAVGDEAGLIRGRKLHSEIRHCRSNVLQNTLINMYAKCGSMIEAHRVFDGIEEPNVVSWNTLIVGYADNGEGMVALDLFSRMKASRRCAPDSVTYLAAIKACTSLAENGDEAAKKECRKQGRRIHSKIGRSMDLFVQSTLINMYAKCGSMEEAQQVFECIKNPDVVSWNALIVGYADNGQGQAALDLFTRMKARPNPVTPDSVTYMAALKACGCTGALDIGRKLHGELSEIDARVLTCLVDFYGKCGSMAEAREAFDSHPRARDTTTWNVLLAGYASFGESAAVCNLFEAMQEQGFRPDAVTFVCLLLCCSHAGLVGKASEYLEAMPVKYRVVPGLMHYNCMVDALGRANKLSEAVALLRQLPSSPDAATWMALLCACRKWKNVELGRVAFDSLVDLDEKIAASYVLMAQVNPANFLRKLLSKQVCGLEPARTSSGVGDNG